MIRETESTWKERKHVGDGPTEPEGDVELGDGKQDKQMGREGAESPMD
jgi:hypothetical protein